MQDVKHPLPGVIPSSLLLQPEFVSTNSTICIFLHRFLRCLFLKFLETTFAWIWLPALTSLKHMEVSNPWGYPILSSISRQDVPLKTIHFWSTLWFFNIAILWAIYTMAMLVITRGYPIYGNPQKKLVNAMNHSPSGVLHRWRRPCGRPPVKPGFNDILHEYHNRTILNIKIRAIDHYSEQLVIDKWLDDY